MMKILKRIGIVCSAILLALSVCAFAACETTAKDPIDYTVTVHCDSAQVLKNVKVKIGSESKSLTDGKAVFHLPAGNYTATLDAIAGMLDAYTYEDAHLTAEKPNATIEIVRKQTEGPGETTKVQYKVTLLYPDGKPVEGVMLQICGGPTYACYNTTATDKNGVGTIELDPYEYEVHVPTEMLPKGYIFDETRYKLTAEIRELTVSLETGTEYTVTVKDGSGAAVANVDLFVYRAGEDVSTAQSVGYAKTDANGSATFYLRAGSYTVVIEDDKNNWKGQGSLTAENTSVTITATK